MHKSLYYFGAHANYSMVIGKFGGLKMAIFQNQVKKRVIIHYSSFDPQIFGQGKNIGGASQYFTLSSD
jgi:hypothetical protein